MFNSLRNRLPDIQETGTAAADRVVKAANTAAQSAKDVTVQLEGWAQEGIDCAKKRPLMWGAASLGIGAAMGGLWAMWRRTQSPVSGRTPPLRSRAKAAKRAPAKANGAASKKGTSKARHNGASAGT